MFSISHLYIYPIKSLGGIELKVARLTDRGFDHDRSDAARESPGGAGRDRAVHRPADRQPGQS